MYKLLHLVNTINEVITLNKFYKFLILFLVVMNTTLSIFILKELFSKKTTIENDHENDKIFLPYDISKEIIDEYDFAQEGVRV